MISENKTKVVISIDTEFESSNVITGNCLQLGFVVILDDPDYNKLDDGSWILETLSLCFKDQPDKEKDENVVNWWLKYPEIYKKIKDESKDIKELMIELQEWLNNIYEKYDVIGFLADHSAVDMPWFRNLFLTHCDQTKTNFVLPWACKCTTNISETLVLLGLTKPEIVKFCNTSKFPHTHYAVDDAIQCGYEYLSLKLLIKQHQLIKISTC